MVYTLAKAGWFGGNPSTVYSTPIDIVFDAYYFEIMSRDYESTYFELNKEKR